MAEHPSESAARIRYQMQRIRHHLDDDVGGLLNNAQQMLSWKYYIQRYPWATLGIAAGIGFLAVPRSRPKTGPGGGLDAETSRQLESLHRKLEGISGEPPRQGMVKSLVMMAASMAVRSGINYLGAQLAQGAFRPPGGPRPEAAAQEHWEPEQEIS